ncbi:class I SAM-dependent methyltransferase [Bacillaceae bacterium W0354]
MESKWVKPFYKKQFEMFSYLHEYSNHYDEFAEEILNQVGKPFTTVLEIGAGNGNLARALASYEKEITTVELVPELVEYAKQYNHKNITPLCGSFYDIEIPKSFDVLLYIDGFGVGDDEDQLFLLKRIKKWLNEDGVGLIDIYNPPYWKEAAGQQMYIDPKVKVLREYGYDHTTNSMTDTWWYEDKPDETYTQVLACYDVNEIKNMCQEAGLKVVDIFPGGAMDWEEWKFHQKVPIQECLSYRIKVVKVY